MGLLDDAIREHLELKRQHGADPGEVAKQEREALGAPRRGEFAQPEGAAGPLDESEDVDEDVDEADLAPIGEVPEPIGPEELEEPFPPARPEPIGPEELEEPFPPARPEPEPEGGHDEESWTGEDPEEERAAAAPAPPREDPQAPGAYRAPEPGEESEDVLEETPEFLQETPEHDRLWFEQKPPRDFDWDK